jgi:hypothetical protein
MNERAGSVESRLGREADLREKLDNGSGQVAFNSLLSAAAARLAKLTSGVVYESDNGVFQ